MKIANVKVSWSTIWIVLKTGLPFVIQAAALVEKNMQEHPGNDVPATIAWAVAGVALSSQASHPIVAQVLGTMHDIAATTNAASTPAQTNNVAKSS